MRNSIMMPQDINGVSQAVEVISEFHFLQLLFLQGKTVFLEILPERCASLYSPLKLEEF